jgi:hypothetical protein
MQDDFLSLNDEEQLKAENDFLKMKLMLERGGHFGVSENSELPPELENQFLNNIMAFEEQFEKHQVIKVFDKIGRPSQFKPVSEISDADIEMAWKELDGYMRDHAINLDVCSPNISARELYRFATEELFEHETDDMDLPRWTTNFIYDEFHPDPVYDNSELVRRDLLYDIFRKEELFNELHYDSDGFVFNGQQYDDYNLFKEKITRFKSLFSEIQLRRCEIRDCVVENTSCVVSGDYKAKAKTGNDELVYEGPFRIELILKDTGYWYMKRIEINGFNAA